MLPFMLNDKPPHSLQQAPNHWLRNLRKNQLGGVIFGCKNNTIRECLFKQLFGLPAQHFSYVKNIEPGLPLFLFNYSDRKMHGIFEAASSGQMNINPYAWTSDGSEKTLYPAQVQIRVRLQCQPLIEDQFKPIIIDNYYNHNHFWFELDHVQASKLLSKLSSLAIAPSLSQPQNTQTWTNIFRGQLSRDKGEESEADNSPILTDDFTDLDGSLEKLDAPDVTLPLIGRNKTTAATVGYPEAEIDEKDLIYLKLKELALDREHAGASIMRCLAKAAPSDDVDSICENSVEEQEIPEEKNNKYDRISFDSSCYPSLAQLLKEVEELKAFKSEHTQKMQTLERKLAEAEQEIRQLKNRCMMSESVSNSSQQLSNEVVTDSLRLHLELNESIFLVGGYDGVSWLSALDLYSPQHDVLRSLKPMNYSRSYASVAKLNGELYVFGGGNGSSWYDTVEVYNPAQDQWKSCPALNGRKGSLASASWKDKIFAIGGGDGKECFSDVEMYDVNVGRWIPARSMLQRRFALAAVELNGVIYAVGGYDGTDYLKSAERFDPREHSWTRIESMSVARGCHSLVIMDEKLHALGGYDGTAMVPSMEIYDPRLCKWILSEPMKQARGYFAAGVVKDSIYVIGGVKSGEDIEDTMEWYKVGEGWHSTTSKAIGRRCFSGAVVLEETS